MISNGGWKCRLYPPGGGGAIIRIRRQCPAAGRDPPSPRYSSIASEPGRRCSNPSCGEADRNHGPPTTLGGGSGTIFNTTVRN
uniref:Uncharacterized protein n=1 Tax=Timema shepardi TaxID=629360 RepID=A0A7R9AQ96_TIMSH|nr:unnamed protein product [Timema shepardi]